MKTLALLALLLLPVGCTPVPAKTTLCKGCQRVVEATENCARCGSTCSCAHCPQCCPCGKK